MSNIIKFEDYHFEVAKTDLRGTFKWGEIPKDVPEGWEVPTIKELMLIFLAKKGLRMSKDTYWSSTERTRILAWQVHFGDGTAYFHEKCVDGHIRLIRRIK